MEISYLGHSSFRIKAGGVFVVTDPFDPKKVGLKFPGVDADVVTVSHGHQDHNAVELVKNAKKILRGPGEYEIMGVSVIGIASYHDAEKGEKRGKNILYIIESENLKIVHLGDLGHKLSDRMLEEIGGVNVLMIPVGGEYTLDAKEAAETARAIEPQIVIPMHFQTPGLNPETFAKLGSVEDFLKEMGLPVERLPKLSVKLSDLGEDQKIVLLEKK